MQSIEDKTLEQMQREASEMSLSELMNLSLYEPNKQRRKNWDKIYHKRFNDRRREIVARREFVR